MKPLFLFVFMALSCGVFAQGSYKSLAECQNDTARYVLYNFSENKERYIGKRMEFMLNEVDIRMLSKEMYVDDSGSYMKDPLLRHRISALRLRYLCYCQRKKRPVSYEVFVGFERTPNNHSNKEFNNRFLDEESDLIPWNDEMTDFFKDFVVRDVAVIEYTYGEWKGPVDKKQDD